MLDTELYSLSLDIPKRKEEVDVFVQAEREAERLRERLRQKEVLLLFDVKRVWWSLSFDEKEYVERIRGFYDRHRFLSPMAVKKLRFFVRREKSMEGGLND